MAESSLIPLSEMSEFSLISTDVRMIAYPIGMSESNANPEFARDARVIACPAS